MTFGGRDFTEFLRGEILSGNILPGEKLMSPFELTRYFHVSPLKVLQAIQILRKEGYLVTFPKKGTFVSGYRRRKVSKNVIGVISKGGNEFNLRPMFTQMETTLNLNGYDMQVRNAGNSQLREEKILKYFLSNHVDGLIIDPSESQMLCSHMELFRRLDQMRVPYIFINSVYPQMFDRTKILIDDAKGGYLLTRHFIATGRSYIVGIFKSDDSRGAERHKGYVTALQEAGIPYRPDLVIWYQTSETDKKARVMLEKVLRSKEGCDGILCYDDDMAVNVIYFLLSQGYRVPEEIGVAGYGNFQNAEAGELGITSVAQPDALFGEMAANLILEKIEGVPDSESRVTRLLAPELVIKSSSIRSAV